MMMTVELLEQLQSDYKKFCKLSKKSPYDTLLVSSQHTSGCKVLEEPPSSGTITIVCKKTLIENEKMISRYPLILVDEFHMAKESSDLFTAIRAESQKDAVVLGFSGTPHKAMNPCLYTYTQQEAIVDGVSSHLFYYNLEVDVKDKASRTAFITNLPHFLKTHVHPHGGTLAENRGMICVPCAQDKGSEEKKTPSELAQEISQNLEKNGIRSLSIISDEDSQENKDKFLNDSGPIVATVVGKLQVGVNPNCDWVMVLRATPNENNLEQTIGRVCRVRDATFSLQNNKAGRKDSIGYILKPKVLHLPDTLVAMNLQGKSVESALQSMQKNIRNNVKRPQITIIPPRISQSYLNFLGQEAKNKQAAMLAASNRVTYIRKKVGQQQAATSLPKVLPRSPLPAMFQVSRMTSKGIMVSYEATLMEGKHKSRSL